MLYLSRLVLDPANPRALTDLFSPYEMHRTLAHAFPAPLPHGRVLFRVDRDPQFGRPVVLLQSPVSPDWSFLAVRPGYLASDLSTENPVSRVLPAGFVAEQVLAFRLRANPAFKRGRRRLAWLRRVEQVAWLQRQGLRHGFGLLTVNATAESPVRCHKGVGERRHCITLQPVLYTGLLQVFRPEALAAIVAAGLGSGKAFGCGLLSLAPPQ